MDVSFDTWLKWASDLRTPDLANAGVALLVGWENRILQYMENPVLFRKDLESWSDSEIRLFEMIQEKSAIANLPGTALYNFYHHAAELTERERIRRGFEVLDS